MPKFYLFSLILLFSPIFAMNPSEKIDQLVQSAYEENEVVSSGPSSDAQFLRRIYLDAIGRIPTYQEAKSFLDSQEKDKRSQLIDQLLESPGYTHHFFNFWADLLRLKSRIKGIYGNQYANWVKQSLRENKPYDQMVRELLTADGSPAENGAVGYYLRDENQRLDTVATTAQLFLGTRIGCAQCHDHPFDKWTQKQFYQLSAFMTGIDNRVNLKKAIGLKSSVGKLFEGKNLNADQQQKLKRIFNLANAMVSNNDEKRLRLPSDYKYKDARPRQVVHPAFLDGEKPKEGKDQDRLDQLSDWITSDPSELFSKVIANRLWKKTMGFALVEPVDDFTDDSEAYNPELLQFLSQLMKTQRYDIKAFLKTIFNSKTYQLAPSEEPLSLRNYYSQAATLRRMTAEQTWDSFVTLIAGNPDQLPNRNNYKMNKQNKAVTEIQRLIAKGDTQKIEQAVSTLIDQAKEGQPFMLEESTMEMQPETSPPMNAQKQSQKKKNKKSKKRKIPKGIIRASELPSPAPEGHFLSDFGQSDREMISGPDSTPSIPQVLWLLNGAPTRALVSRNSQLYQNILNQNNPKDRIDTLWLSLLSRYPKPQERQLAASELKKYRANAFAHLAMAIVNSREFHFIQ